VAGGNPSIPTDAAFRSLVRACGATVTEKDLDKIIAAVGQSCDLAAFLDVMHERESIEGDLEHKKAALRKAFVYLDKDKSGTLDPEEFKGLMTSKGEAMDKEAVNAMMADFHAADADGDGKLSIEEFVSFLLDD